MQDAWRLLVFEQRLADFHAVTRLHEHGRLHANIVVAKQRHRTDGRARMDALNRLPGNWKIQSLLDLMNHISCLAELIASVVTQPMRDARACDGRF